MPSVEANIDITPAAQADAQPGESDLIIDWQQGLPVRLTLSADDAGSKATGKYQGNVSISVDHWWTLNDVFYVSFSQGLKGGGAGPKGTRGHTIHYSVPWGYWLLGLTASRYAYQQTVAGPFENYLYSGVSQNNEIKLSRLLYRDASRKLTASLRGYFKESSSFIAGTELDHHRRRLAGWELALAHREYIGRGALAIQVAHQRGTGALNALPAAEAESGEGTSYPKLFSAEVALDLPFTLAHQKIRYNGVWRAQWQRTPLLPQDRFSLGGRYTVRGFDGELTLLAERGWLIRNDLGLALGSSGQELYLGVDYGQLGGPSTEFLQGSQLAGGVIGLRGGFKNMQYDVFVGRPFKKPAVFDTANVTAGFSASYSF